MIVQSVSKGTPAFAQAQRGVILIRIVFKKHFSGVLLFRVAYLLPMNGSAYAAYADHAAYTIYADYTAKLFSWFHCR